MSDCVDNYDCAKHQDQRSNESDKLHILSCRVFQFILHDTTTVGSFCAMIWHFIGESLEVQAVVVKASCALGQNPPNRQPHFAQMVTDGIRRNSCFS